MTTTTPDAAVQPTTSSGRPRWLPRFGLAFALGLAAALVLGALAMYAYDQQYQGRILPGVRVAGVDLSGLDEAAASDVLARTLAGHGQGRVVIDTGTTTVSVAYADFGRRADVDAMVADALAVGRGGSPADRAVAEIRTVLRGVDLPVRITLDGQGLERRISAELWALERAPVDATIAFAKTGYTVVPAVMGRSYDETAVANAAFEQVTSVDAPAEVVVPAPASQVQPIVDDTDTMIARTRADRMVGDVTLVEGDESWTLAAETVRGWLSFGTTADGRVEPVADQGKIETSLADVAAQLERPAKNAGFVLSKSGAISGVTAGQNGRTLDPKATAERILAVLAARAAAQTEPTIEPVLSVSKPALTTAEAEAAAPLMKRISTWTTWFPISDHNGYGANIWIPAGDINGYVLAPGETFDFWKAIGPVTYERGYRDGGAIINGRTEPQGALAGGICSCSTTLFNAALRAGLDMGARRNHYYYITRYPLGLDATVYKSGSGSVQTMSFTNDTKHPILIRGINTRNGSKGYVRFDLYSVPTGRTVSLSKPVVKNVKPATTNTVSTSSLRPGVRQQTEYPADGKDVWVTRTVRDASGKVIHQETYYSHYARVDGIILVGKGTTSSGGSTSPSPTPSPAPSAAPSQAPAPSP
jgi:vancomycin resistance protein YoaR